MKILLSGGSGLIGSALIPHLKSLGYEVKSLVRKQTLGPDEIWWDVDQGVLDPSACESFDYVINLAGENIGAGRWTQERKNKIKESRVKTTRLLMDTLSKVKNKPKAFINASAVGYYGNRGSEILNETDTSGEGFLAEVCEEWEAEALRGEKMGIRVACARFGMVLSKKGGGLKTMLTPFKLGLGGTVGAGEQYISWIAIDDVVSALTFIMEQEGIREGINVTSPNPVKNKEFTQILGHVLKRPTIIPLPEFVAKLVLGEMAEEVLLASHRAVPKKLRDSGYEFQYPNLEQALQHCIEA